MPGTAANENPPAVDLGALLPAGVHGVVRAAAPPPRDWERRFPAEAESVRSAVFARRNEYATGRACAREALRLAGGPACELPRGPSGLPAWPEGYVGSISHSRGLCLAVAAVAPEVASLGVDVERLGRLRESTAERVLHPGEQAFAGADLDRATLLFSLKEAFYKAVSGDLSGGADFGDVQLSVDPGAGRASLEWLDERRFPKGPELRASLSLRFVCGENCVAAVAWRPA